jgi:hypothetical protein
MQLLKRHELEFLPKEDEEKGKNNVVEMCVNDSYLAIYNNIKDCLVFCKHDLTVIDTRTMPMFGSSLTCTYNFVYFRSFARGIFRCTDQDRGEKRLFDDHRVFVVVADIETDLLYIGFSDTIFIGNEQGEVLHQFQLLHYWNKLFVSCNLVLTSYTEEGSFFLHTRDGKQITEKIDQRIRRSNICLIHNQGIVVTMDEDKINLWRLV